MLFFLNKYNSKDRPGCQALHLRSYKRVAVSMGCCLLRLAVTVLTFLGSHISYDLIDMLVSN